MQNKIKELWKINLSEPKICEQLHIGEKRFLDIINELYSREEIKMRRTRVRRQSQLATIDTSKMLMQIKELWKSDLTLAEICKLTFKGKNERFTNFIKEHFSKEEIQQRRSRIHSQNNARVWKGTKFDNQYQQTKYVYMLAPIWWTGVSKDYIMAHQLVYCSANNLTEIPQGYCIHHIDFNKSNNHLSNLQLLTKADHAKLHMNLRHKKSAETIETIALGESNVNNGVE